ncbi:MAG TPA: ABC transporter permease, partial [Candidatus Sulfotelmatobacter sp.]|nr:ABC transporter permease [Candidatus Sulfotelmatobacter sp.]
MWRHLRELYEYREVAFWLAVRQVKSRYKQTLLGGAWAVIQPFLVMVVFTLVFSKMARMPSEGVPYPVFSYSGLLFWMFFSTSLTTATPSLVSNSDLIRKIYFPRETLLLAAIAAGLVDLAIASLVLAGMLWYFGVFLRPAMLLVVPVLLLQLFLTFGIVCITSAVHIRFRDVGHALPLLVQVWLFVSPVAYPLSAVPERYHLLYMVNPFAGLIEAYRRVILSGVLPGGNVLAPAAL